MVSSPHDNKRSSVPGVLPGQGCPPTMREIAATGFSSTNAAASRQALEKGVIRDQHRAQHRCLR